MNAKVDRQGNLYIARFEELAGGVSFDDGSGLDVTFTGEILLYLYEQGEGQTFIIEDIRRFAISSEAIEEVGGVMAFAGPAGDINFEPGPSGQTEIEFQLYYPLLSESLDPVCQDSDAVFSPLELLQGAVQLELAKEPSPDRTVNISVTVELKAAEDSPLGKIQYVALGATDLLFQPLPHFSQDIIRGASDPPDAGALFSGAADLAALAMCNTTPAFGSGPYLHGTLNIRFVSFSDPGTASDPNLDYMSPGDLQPLAQEWVNSACKVWWEKGGIKIAPQFDDPTTPTEIVIETASYNNGVIDSVIQEARIHDPAFTSLAADPSRVEVYLVDELNAPGRSGGGVAYHCGTNNAYVIMEIGKAEHNRYLLAHELGHVLGLRHPGGGGCPDYPLAAYCSVMVPDKPNSSRNSVHNFDNLATGSWPATPSVPPVFVADSSGGILADEDGDIDPTVTPNTDFFHMVRDFQYDDGTTSSVPEVPATDWWSQSDVWNFERDPSASAPQESYADGQSIIKPDNSPRHCEPWYSEHENYMYARVHTCQPLADEPPDAPGRVEVYLFLAVPGVTSEALHQLIPPTVPATEPYLHFDGPMFPSPGAPRINYLQWSVPSGYPSACCVFAVARSNNETTSSDLAHIIDHPNMHDFRDLFMRLKSDNDVAQRNLHIQGSSSSSASSALPTMAVENISEETTEADVEIDANGAEGIVSITVIVNDEVIEKIEAGRPQRVRLREDMRPGELLNFRLRAELSPEQSLGATSPISLRFFLGDELVNGFQHVIRITTLDEAATQMLDVVYGALRDVTVAWGSDIASDLARDVRIIVWRERGIKARRGCWGMILELFGPKRGSWESEFRKLAKRFDALAGSMREVDNDDPEYKAASQYLDSLADSFDLRGTEFVERIRDLAFRIQYSAGRVVRRNSQP